MNCPYCQKPVGFIKTSESVYRKDYGPLYICRPCEAWVGCHPGTDKPLGRLADKDLRIWKRNAHAAFDPIWREGKCTRKNAYLWLSGQLGISVNECHIGMFDTETCKRVVEICK